MGPEAIWLAVDDEGRRGTYGFTCPSCQDQVEKAADRKTVALLISAGVDLESVNDSDLLEAPWPMFERDLIEPLGSLADAPPLSLDDLIDFHFLLEDERYVEESLLSLLQ